MLKLLFNARLLGHIIPKPTGKVNISFNVLSLISKYNSTIIAHNPNSSRKKLLTVTILSFANKEFPLIIK